MNRYLSLLVNADGVFYVPNKTMKAGERSVKGELAGAVLLPHQLPTAGHPRPIHVALPVAGTHDHHGYLVARLSSEALESDVLGRQDRTVMALEAASLAIHGYLEGQISAAPLAAIERTEPILQVLRRNR